MESTTMLSWDEISDVAEELLEGIGWSDDLKFLWAEKAWGGIENNGLADYRNELEKCKVYIRLISIVVLYGEFCSITTEETFYPDFYGWMDRLELSSIRIGQLVGPTFDVEESDQYDLIELAISELVNKTMPEVLKSISQEFGDTNLLFVGLWLTYENSTESEDDLEYEDLISVNAEYVLNYDTSFKKLEAYSWLDSLI